MTLDRINPPQLPRPSGFAHAVAGCGHPVFLAGQTGQDGAGRIVTGGVVAQFDQALQNLLIALRAAGGAPEHLAALTIYIVDVDDYRANAGPIGAVWRRLMGTDYPATAGVGVSRLWDVDALVELQATAVLPVGILGCGRCRP
jgi:enamine deaminase RidA (YjgF/YER057c/UK114 family)